MLPLAAYPGQGRDGGWPESIQFLRLAKANLLELLAQSSDQDVRDAINGMHDRDESIKVKDVDLALLTKLVKSLENPDVEQIEKSKYDGVRLFSYDDSDPSNLRIFATKNFFAKQRYQLPLNEINPAILKEVQTLILHEISHLWGFGEENGDINFARTFAVRMVNILHGSLKITFTPKEKLELLSKAFYYSTADLMETNAEKVYGGKNYECITYQASGENSLSIQTLELDPYKRSVDGYNFQGNQNSVLRWNPQGFLFAETSEQTFNKKELLSQFMLKKNVYRRLKDVTVCHQDKEQLASIEDRFIRPYFSRTNLLTDYANSSLPVFQSRLVEDIRFYGETAQATLEVHKANQNQIIQNIDFKIKVEHAEAYDRLTGRKYKYSKPQDSGDMDTLNSLINSGFSDQHNALWAQISVKTKQLNGDIIALRDNVSRQLQMNSFFKDFLQEFNRIADRTKNFYPGGLPCGKEKRLGDYYACQLESSKVEAQARIKLYEGMAVDLDALMKRFSNRAYSIKD